MTQTEKILAAMSDGRYGVREAIALVTNNPAERKELTMITKGELKDALGAVQWAVENGQVMACPSHDKVCPQGQACAEHVCVMGAFMRALFSSSSLYGFPTFMDLDRVFTTEGLKPVAKAVPKIMWLNDTGQFGDALAELKAAVESC